jgi:flavin-binding protein dodecin
MARGVYKLIELVGTSSESWQRAAAAAVSQVSKTVRDLRIADVSALDVPVIIVSVLVLATGWVIHEVQGATANELHVVVSDSAVRQRTAASVTIASTTRAQRPAAAPSTGVCGRPLNASRTCASSRRSGGDNSQPLPAGDAPAFLLASVQPLKAPASWRRIYHEVEQCAGRWGDYDAIRWGVMEAPLQGPKGSTYAFTVGRRIVLARGDTTYLRHEMLHHILEVSGWHPRALKPGEHYTIADLHPMPLFGLCTGGQ